MGTHLMILNLGVVDQPYRANGSRKPSTRILGITTGQVAKILEDRYGIMEAYYERHGREIAKSFSNSLSGGIESLLAGHRVDPFGKAMQEIRQGFRDFIMKQEIESMGLRGVQTKAALKGINHRLRHPYRKSNPRRPSFVDTGLYVASFRAWMEL